MSKKKPTTLDAEDSAEVMTRGLVDLHHEAVPCVFCRRTSTVFHLCMEGGKMKHRDMCEDCYDSGKHRVS